VLIKKAYHAHRSVVALSHRFSIWADLTVCASVLERNPVSVTRYLLSNGFDFRFRAYVQIRRAFSHWHGLCPSAVMVEVKNTRSSSIIDEQLSSTSQLDEKYAAALLRQNSTVGAGDGTGSRRLAKRRKRRQAKAKTKKSWLRTLAMSKGLERFVSGIIVLNTCTMMMDMDRKSFTGTLWRSDEDFRRFLGILEAANGLFTVIFTTECIIKIVGMGTNAITGDHLFWPSAPLAYFRNGFNIFDFVVVILTGLQIPQSIEMTRCYFVGTTDKCASTNAGVSVLRSFRLARLVRLIRNFPQVQAQVLNLVKVARPAAAQSVIILIFIIIFSIMGKDLLGFTLMTPPQSLSEISINARVYVRARQLSGSFARRHPGRVLRIETARTRFPVLVEVVQSWSLLSQGASKRKLWVTVLERTSKWDEFAGWAQDPCLGVAAGDLGGQEGGEAEDAGVAKCQGGLVVGMVPRANFETMEDGLLTTFQLFSLENWNVLCLQARVVVGPIGEGFVGVVLMLGNLVLLNTFVAIVALGFGDAAKDAAQKRMRKLRKLVEEEAEAKGFNTRNTNDEEKQQDSGPGYNVPLRVFGMAMGGKNDPTLRYYIGVFVTSKLFSNAILGGIVLSTVLLAAETYPPVTGPAREVIDDANTALNLLFGVELLLKNIWFGPKIYISNGWNKMDAFIVATSLIDEILTQIGNDGEGAAGNLQMLRILRVFRCIRALRALRVLASNQTVRIVSTTLLHSARPIAVTGH
jgi:hypothetical protein